MFAAPGRMMMAWVWLSLVTLARLNTGGIHRDADGRVADLEALFSDSEPQVETRSGGSFFPVPVWKFLKGRDDDDGDCGDEDFSRPHFLCSNSSLSVRFSLIRHSDLRLLDGKKLLALPDGCRGSARTVGPWLQLELPYTGCHTASWISNSARSHQLKVRYFDHLLQANVTGAAACKGPAALLQPAPLLVKCRTTDVTVKLPLGATLRRVKALGKDGVVGTALTMSSSGAVMVQISTTVNTDSILEMVYCNSDGEMSTMLAACFRAETQSVAHHPRAYSESDYRLELLQQWELEKPTEDVSAENLLDDETETTTAGPSEGPTVTAPVTIQATYPDSEIFELWGFDEIPDGPFTGDQTALPTTSSTTPTTTVTTTPTTTVTTTPTTTSSTTPTTTVTTTPTTTSSTTPTTTVTTTPTTTTSSTTPTTTTSSTTPTTTTSSTTPTTTSSTTPTTTTSGTTPTTTSGTTPTTTVGTTPTTTTSSTTPMTTRLLSVPPQRLPPPPP
ncbi:mucin-5AC-like isoform X2 [Scomber scombrus]|uniref:Mucin-5AC-like isoform X2 n=1 Tax=Scomber scombrus TaxID=13677 RepID=A0AAV1QE56_SCOSC